MCSAWVPPPCPACPFSHARLHSTFATALSQALEHAQSPPCQLICVSGLIVCEALCAGYLGSIGATLYASVVLHSYILSLLCCAVQVRC